MLLNRDQARRLAFFNGVARCVLGGTALIIPPLPLAPWVGQAQGDRAARLLARSLGARDIALGLGALLALRHEAPVRGWVEAGGLADAGDVVATLGAFTALPRWGRWAVLAAASGGVLAAGLASRAVDNIDAVASPAGAARAR
jgi:hypothetical protein